MAWTNGATGVHEQARGNIADLPPHYQASLAKFNQPTIEMSSSHTLSAPATTPIISSGTPKSLQ